MEYDSGMVPAIRMHFMTTSSWKLAPCCRLIPSMISAKMPQEIIRLLNTLTTPALSSSVWTGLKLCSGNDSEKERVLEQELKIWFRGKGGGTPPLPSGDKRVDTPIGFEYQTLGCALTDDNYETNC